MRVLIRNLSKKLERYLSWDMTENESTITWMGGT